MSFSGWLRERRIQPNLRRHNIEEYWALAGFVVAEAIVFVPLLVIAEYTAPGVIESAALVTLLGFAGLTGVAFMTRKDFSFLGSLLWWGGIVALVLIVASVIFGFQLGTFFSVAMIALAGGAILYDTSNVLHHYPPGRQTCSGCARTFRICGAHVLVCIATSNVAFAGLEVIGSRVNTTKLSCCDHTEEGRTERANQPTVNPKACQIE